MFLSLWTMERTSGTNVALIGRRLDGKELFQKQLKQLLQKIERRRRRRRRKKDCDKFPTKRHQSILRSLARTTKNLDKTPNIQEKEQRKKKQKGGETEGKRETKAKRGERERERERGDPGRETGTSEGERRIHRRAVKEREREGVWRIASALIEERGNDGGGRCARGTRQRRGGWQRLADRRRYCQCRSIPRPARQVTPSPLRPHRPWRSAESTCKRWIDKTGRKKKGRAARERVFHDRSFVADRRPTNGARFISRWAKKGGRLGIEGGSRKTERQREGEGEREREIERFTRKIIEWCPG